MQWVALGSVLAPLRDGLPKFRFVPMGYHATY